MDKASRDLLTDQAEAGQWFVDTFSSDAGQKVLTFLRDRFYVTRTTWSEQGGLDASQLAYREGMRAVVLFIADLSEFDLTAARRILEAGEKPAAPDPLAV